MKFWNMITNYKIILAADTVNTKEVKNKIKGVLTGKFISPILLESLFQRYA